MHQPKQFEVIHHLKFIISRKCICLFILRLAELANSRTTKESFERSAQMHNLCAAHKRQTASSTVSA